MKSGGARAAGALIFWLSACQGFGASQTDGAGDQPSPAEQQGSPDSGVVVGNGKSAFAIHTNDAQTMVQQGATAKVPILVERLGDAVSASITVRVISQAAISGTPVIIPPDAKSAELELSVASECPQGPLLLTLEATAADNESSKVTTTAPLFVRGPAGSLDTTFGQAGTVRFASPVTSHDLLVQQDDKLVAIGSTTSTPVVLRLSPDGAVDSTFGKNGLATIATGNSSLASGAFLSTEKILVVQDDTTQDTLRATRLNTDGTTDTTFGTSGSVTFPSPGSGNSVKYVAIAPDDAIAVAQTCWPRAVGGTYAYRWCAIRLQPNGTPLNAAANPTYGNWASSIAGVAGVIIRPSTGAFVGSGTEGNKLGLFQFTATHYLDGSFGTSGTPGLFYVDVPTASGTYGSHLLVEQPDGKLVSAFERPYVGYQLVRFLANGSAVDTTFGSAGFVLASGSIRSLARAKDGSYVTVALGQGQWFLRRVDANGGVDTSFGSNGEVLRVSTLDRPSSVVLQRDGRIVVMGYAGSPGTEFFLQRFWN